MDTKKKYVMPLTETVRPRIGSLMLTGSDNNGTPTDLDNQETIWSGGSVENGDFAKGSGWGNLWED